MTTYTSQGLASRLGYGLGRVVRFFLHDQNPTLRWVKRLVLMSVILLFSIPLFSWITSVLMGVATIALFLLVMAKAEGVGLTANSGKSQSLWDKNGPNSLWHHEDESRKR